MSQFHGVKCDECGRIQGEANHWEKVRVLLVDGRPVVVALGSVDEKVYIGGMVASVGSLITTELRDLCGQGCAMKHIAKLLGWNVTSEG